MPRSPLKVVALVVMLLCLVPACGKSQDQGIAAYHASMDALMAQNAAVASRFLVLAKAVHKDKVDPNEIIKRIKTEVIPESDRLKDEIAAVKTRNPELEQLHAQAVNAWKLQAQGYHDVVTAWETNKPDLFNEGQRKIGQAKVLEETFIKDANAIMEPVGYHLEEFPQGR